MFRKKTPLRSSKTEYPTGTVVSTENGTFFVKGGTLLRVSPTVMQSWNFGLIVTAKWSAIQHMPIVGKLGFRDGTVLRAFGTQKVYIISGQRTRHITDPEVIRALGITLNDILNVSDDDVRLNTEGEPLGSI